MGLFKLANEEASNRGILIDKDLFLQALKGVKPKETVKVEQVTV